MKQNKSNAKTEIVNYYTKSDKEKLLYNIVDISLKYPKDAIEDKIYTGVGGKEILESCKASKASFKSRQAPGISIYEFTIYLSSS